MSKKIKCIFMILCCLGLTALFVGCSKAESKTTNNEFILTVTSNEENDRFLNSISCLLDKNSKELKHIASIKHNAQYSLTYYDKDSNLVYYATNENGDRSGGDQLYSYDVKTKKSTQLTNGLLGINYIIPMEKSKIFLIAAKKGEHNISPGYYDLSKNKYVDLEWDPDFFVTKGQKDPQTENIYISGYSNDKDYKKMDSFNNKENGAPYGIDNKIYQISDTSMDLIFETKDRYIDSFVINGNKLICSTSLRGQEIYTDAKYISYDLDTKEENELENIDITGDLFYLDSDGKYVYTNTGSEIIKLNLDNNKQESILKLKSSEAWINNAQY